jgi:hypothetical protein
MKGLRHRWEAPKNFDDVIQRIAAASTNQAQLNEIFDTLVSYQPLLNYHFGRGSIYWRGRRAHSEVGFKNVRDLGPPPPSITKVGRLNDSGRINLIRGSSTRGVCRMVPLHFSERSQELTSGEYNVAGNTLQFSFYDDVHGRHEIR